LWQIYADWGVDDERFYDLLDRSYHPRGSSILLDKLAWRGLDKESLVLDIGCRDGASAIELAAAHGCTVLAMDIALYNARTASQACKLARVENSVRVLAASIESLPIENSTADFIWCTDVLNHVHNLAGVFAEAERTLKPGGMFLVLHTFKTELLEPREASRLCRVLAIEPETLKREYFEDALHRTALRIVEVDEIGAELIEYDEEEGSRRTSRQILHVARIMRLWDQLSRQVDPSLLHIEAAYCHWYIYQAIGKLTPVTYLLGRGR
jgi:ubiquinone/menaquinone biosynthesis C-methylase UbiE